MWRAVDRDGNVLAILLQNRRDTAAARRFFRKLMKKTRQGPRVVITDKLASYGAAHRRVMPSVEDRSHKGLNNRAETRPRRHLLTATEYQADMITRFAVWDQVTGATRPAAA